MSTFQHPLSNAQIELLNLFAQSLPDESLVDLKRVLLQFKFDQLERLADAEWEAKNMDQDTIEKRLHGHQRTPYQAQQRSLKKE